MGRKVNYEDEIINKKFNRLLVKEIIREKSKETKALCDCECGNKDVVVSVYRLINGLTKSCGCLTSEARKKTGKNNHKTNKYDLSGEYGIGYTSKGEEFYFDLEDYDKIKNYCWCSSNSKYICGRINGTMVLLHRIVMGVDDINLQVDHINHNGFDNRKYNLRIVDNSKNNMNKNYQKNNKLGIKGVYKHSQHSGYCADIGYNNRTIHLGCFKNLDEAIKARKEAEEKYFGKYSYDNSQKYSKSYSEPGKEPSYE